MTNTNKDQEKLAENTTQVEQVAKAYSKIKNTPVADEVYTIAKSYSDKHA